MTDVILWSNVHPSPLVPQRALANQNDVVLNIASFSLGSGADTLSPAALAMFVKNYLNAAPPGSGYSRSTWSPGAHSAKNLSEATRRGSLIKTRIYSS